MATAAAGVMNSPSPPAAGAGSGQVWKKVKCDGAAPTCGNCASAAVTCVVTKKLRRRTKIRGYPTPAEEQVKTLQSENDELKRALQAERDINASLRQRLGESPGPSPATTSNLRGDYVPARASNTFSGNLETPGGGLQNRSALIIKHMGRLVPDSVGGERFAGSTSAVHFVLSVQQALQSRRIYQMPFPESCFSIHLMELFGNSTELLNTADLDTRLPGLVLQNPKQYLPLPLAFYLQEVDHFVDGWGSFCPIVAALDISNFLRSILDGAISASREGIDEQMSLLFQLCIVLLLNRASTSSESRNDYDMTYLRLVRTMVPRLIGRGDMPSLQALSLFSLYLQVTGQILLMAQLNGILVRLAQSLGLHRHSRRFKFVEGQVEMRKRVWWWVYMYDKVTSIALGLPRLIVDADVDVDLPLDCELNEVNTRSLSYPLPGESTRVSPFIAYIHLGRILYEALSELYTTTRRRHGAEKIAKLEHDLQSWEQRFKHNMIDPDRQTPHAMGSDCSSRMSIWISVMANIVRIMIHRPALTFDENVAPFAESLSACVEASSSIIIMLSHEESRSEILGIIPAGPSLVFQCGLMLIYHECLKGSGYAPFENSMASSQQLIEMSVNILDTYSPAVSGDLDRRGVVSGQFAAARKEVAELLRSLASSLQDVAAPDVPQLAASEVSSQNVTSPAILSQFTGMDTDPMQFAFLGGLGALDTLNHLGRLDWVFDSGGLADSAMPLQ